MDGTSAQGISACPRFPGSQELFSPENPSTQSFSQLQVIDSGLTPSPGSQLQQRSNTTRESLEREERDPSDREAGLQDHAGEAHRETNGEEYDPPVGSLNYEIEVSSKEINYPQPNDPLFDPAFGLGELEAAFESRKRTGDEAFADFDLWGPPEKRKLVGTPSVANNPTPPGETPSLSSPNSSFRPDPVETAPHTPNDIGQSTSASLFDTLDPLFDDPEFSLAFDISPEDLQLDFQSLENGVELSGLGHLNGFDPEQASAPATSDVTPAPPLMSDLTQQRFSLDAQDVIANTGREISQRVDQERQSQYISPYPAYGGPLGYMPSAPGIHVRCIEVAEDRLNYRMNNLQHKLNQAKNERDKYKSAFLQCSGVDESTGKTRLEMLREENSNLRRVSSQHRNRVEEYKKEAQDWKDQLNLVSTLYNNLLYEINVQKRTPAVAPAPAGYKPRPVQGTHNRATPNPAQPSTPAPTQQSAITHAARQYQPPMAQTVPGTPVVSRTTVVNQPATQNSQPHRAATVLAPAPALAPVAKPRSERITIDLTEDTDDVPCTPALSPAPTKDQTGSLQALRNKKYEWLENNNQMQMGYQSQPWRPNSPFPFVPSPKVQEAAVIQEIDQIGDDEDLLRMMEEELGRG